MSQTHCDTIIIGAGAAGLACGATLKRAGQDVIILERSPGVANTWRGHYDRLHLHTNKGSSKLPYSKMPGKFTKYPSRDQVVSYLEDYAVQHDLKTKFNCEVTKVVKGNGQWSVHTKDSALTGDNLIICTGNTNKPNWITKPGLETFPGPVIHSSEYQNGSPFKGKKVLVVGFGNSACEIAICLHEHGARPSMLVRSAVNVIPRDVLGVPSLLVGIATSRLPPKLADTLNAPLINLIIGNLKNYGLRKLPYGPVEQIVKHHKIPLLDIGTMKLIRKGVIDIRPDIVNINQSTIDFADGVSEIYDAIILATGYHHGLEEIIEIPEERLKDITKPIEKRKLLGDDNLYFCGFYVSPSGMLREIRIEALAIAERMSRKQG